jgi:hypothetical protein
VSRSIEERAAPDRENAGEGAAVVLIAFKAGGVAYGYNAGRGSAATEVMNAEALTGEERARDTPSGMDR